MMDWLFDPVWVFIRQPWTPLHANTLVLRQFIGGNGCLDERLYWAKVTKAFSSREKSFLQGSN